MTFQEYNQYDALGLAQLVKQKAVTPLELLEIAIARSEAVNGDINAIIHPLYEMGRDMAKGINPDSPFSGVPLLIKDLGAHIKGTPLRNGCRGWSDYISEEDSYLVQQLRDAGFVFFGKTNTPELGLTPYTEPELFGPTRNPWDTARTAGGSSGGSGAAVAAGIVPIATASDGGGSIRIPASCCGLFGIKSSRGRISLGPQAAQGWSGAVVQGAISYSVRDSAAFLDATNRHYFSDPYQQQIPARPFLEEVGKEPGSLRIGFSTQHTLGHQIHPECKKAVEKAAARLADLGHQVEEVPLPYQNEELTRSFLYVILGETASSIAELEKHLGRKVKSGIDVEPNNYAQFLAGQSISAEEYVSHRSNWNKIAVKMAAFHQQYDFLLTTTVAEPPFKIGALQSSASEQRLVRFVNALGMGSVIRRSLDALAEKIFSYIPYTAFSNMTGQPSMSVPLHQTEEGLPVGVMLTAAFGREDLCFRLASQLEQAFPWEKPELEG